MAHPNPYAAPTATAVEAEALSGCPQCGSQDIKAPSFTWWGGALGPKLLHHRVCVACKYGFHANTRQSNSRAVILYAVTVNVIAFVVMLLLFLFAL